jgi:hypothetical protein
MNSKNIVYNPYFGINPKHLSTCSLCWNDNQIASCVNFTPNTMIEKYSSNVYHGMHGNGVIYIVHNKTNKR